MRSSGSHRRLRGHPRRYGRIRESRSADCNASRELSPSLRQVKWMVDVSDASTPLPPVLAAAVAEAVARPAVQQPAWPDLEELAQVRAILETVPPIAVPAEVDRLRERLGMVARGEAFPLQGGDCAETFVVNTE